MTPNDLDKYERLVSVMKDWAEWVKGYRIRIGYPSRSIGLVSHSLSDSFDDMLEAVENEMCRLIDTAINDLPDDQKESIHRCYGLTSFIRLKKESYERLIIQAHENLLKTLPKKGVAI